MYTSYASVYRNRSRQRKYLMGKKLKILQACGGRVREDDIGGAVGAGAGEALARHRGREDHKSAQSGDLSHEIIATKILYRLTVTYLYRWKCCLFIQTSEMFTTYR